MDPAQNIDGKADPLLESVNVKKGRPEFHEVISDILESIKEDRQAVQMTDLDLLVSYLDRQHRILSKFVPDREERTKVWHGLIAALSNYWYGGYHYSSPLKREINRHPKIIEINGHGHISYENRKFFLKLVLQFAPETLTYKNLGSFVHQHFLFLCPGQNSHHWASMYFRRDLEESGEKALREIGPNASRVVDSYFEEKEKYRQEQKTVAVIVHLPKNIIDLELAEKLNELGKRPRLNSCFCLERCSSSHLENILSLDEEHEGSVVLGTSGERNRWIIEKAAKIMEQHAAKGLTPANRLETEIVKVLNLERVDKFDGRRIAKHAGHSLDKIAVFLAYIARSGCLYFRSGSHVFEHYETETICVAEHYDGVKTGGVVEIGTTRSEIPFREGGEGKALPIFRGSYCFHDERGLFLRIDPPVHRARYCTAKGIDDNAFSDMIVSDYIHLLRRFKSSSSEEYQTGWKLGTGFSADFPINRISDSPTLVVNDYLRSIFSEKGIHLPKYVTLGAALEIISGSRKSEKFEASKPLDSNKAASASTEELSREVHVAAEEGLHLRVMTRIAEAAQLYPETDVTATYNGIVASAKIISELMLLGAGSGAKISVTAKGKRKQEALDAVCKILREAS